MSVHVNSHLTGAAHIANKNGVSCQCNFLYRVAEVTLLHFCAIARLYWDALFIVLYSYIYAQLDQAQPTNEDIGREYLLVIIACWGAVSKLMNGDAGYNCISYN
jgi:hypothetical protein